AMAYRVGAELMDMEMVQYHPTTLARRGFLITEGARGEAAHLLNAKGERFMERYAPNKMELASRDVVSRAEQTEIEEGRGFGEGRSGERAAARGKRSDPGREPKAALADQRRETDAIVGRERGSGRRISEIRHEMSVVMDRHIGVFREAEGIREALEVIRRLKEAARSADIDDRGTA